MTTEQKVEQTEVTNTEAQESYTMDTAIGKSFTTKGNNRAYADEIIEIHTVVDAGASNTRSIALHQGKPVSKKDIRVYDSQYAVVEGLDMSMYKRTTDTLEDNGEYIIQEDSESPYIADTMFGAPTHVLKGNLMNSTGRAARNINNQHDKAEDIGVFINILTTLANEGYLMGVKNLKQRIGILLPPKERYSSTENLQLIKNRLAGTYTIKMPRFNYECQIIISDTDIHLEAEGETAFMYFTSIGTDAAKNFEELKEQLVVINDLGSSTFNLSLIDSLRIKSGASHTAKFGGENLISQLYLILSRSLKIPVSFDQARTAVETGFVQSGSKKIPVGKELTRAKMELAEKLYKEYITFLQIANIHATTVHTNLFIGRGMLSTGKVIDGEPNDEYSPSIGQILHEMYINLSEDTNGKIVPSPGLANLLGLATIMKFQWKL